jgi:hypothetical protein
MQGSLFGFSRELCREKRIVLLFLAYSRERTSSFFENLD